MLREFIRQTLVTNSKPVGPNAMTATSNSMSDANDFVRNFAQDTQYFSPRLARRRRLRRIPIPVETSVRSGWF